MMSNEIAKRTKSVERTQAEMKRSEEEREADEVMMFIEHLHISPYRSEAVLSHLTALHKLRDKELYGNVLNRFWDQTINLGLWDPLVHEFEDALDEMQTF